MSNAGGPQIMNNLPPGVNAENNLLPGGPILNRNRNNNQNPLFNVRERLFHALFFKFAVAYARTFPRPVRRFFEFLVLLKAIVAFFVLAYIHIAFSRTPTTCLNHVKDSWPRDGILRVEILRNPAQDYSIEQSYAKEHKLKKDKDDLNSMLGILATEGFINIESSSNDDVKEDEYLRDGTDYGNITRIHENEDGNPEHIMETAYMDPKTEGADTSADLDEGDLNATIVSGEDVEPSSSIWDGIMGLVEDLDRDSKVVEESTDEGGSDDSSKDDDYILEYSLEYGFLRLSPSARLRLKIPVKIVTLDPSKDECFGDPFSRFVLDEFLGYDDLLMASIKSLAEQEDNKGYLRNVITGEHYRFVSMLTARSSYIAAFFIMLVFIDEVDLNDIYSIDIVQANESIPTEPESDQRKHCKLYETLTKYNEGKGLLLRYQEAGLLDNAARRRLCNIIINEELKDEPQKTLSSARLYQLAFEITEIFKKESSAVYFIPFASFSPTQKTSAKGKLLDCYRQRRRDYIKSGVITARGRRSSASSISSSSELDAPGPSTRTHAAIMQLRDNVENNIEEKMLWLKNCCDPWENVEKYWEMTTKTRLELLNQNECTIQRYYSEFKALNQPGGIFLLLKDYTSLYPNNQMMTEKWLLIRPKLIELAKKRSDAFLKDILAEVFNVDLLQMLEFNVTVSFPAAPLLTVILALVGMEAIMSEFFNDTTTAFYIILIVWIADQYDAICCHTAIAKRHWLRFFYLYHFSFYAYHYRFNGQYSSLALVTSWLFIQHSMLYFFHHYELPVILQQAQLQQLLLRTHHGMGGMVGLAGIAALASGAAYHDAPGTGTQATPPTTQSTTQTVQDTTQSTTQTTPEVSTAQTNTTHTGDVVSLRTVAAETTATGTNTGTGNENVETPLTISTDNKTKHRSDTIDSISPSGGHDIKIEEISRKNSRDEDKVVSGSNVPTAVSNSAMSPSADAGKEVINNGKDETSTLDRRRKGSGDMPDADPPLISTTAEFTDTERRAPNPSAQPDELD